jgi:predicted PurR-regulated permease PerM
VSEGSEPPAPPGSAHPASRPSSAPPATHPSSAPTAPRPTSRPPRSTPLLPRWASGPSPGPPRRIPRVAPRGGSERWVIGVVALLFAWLAFRTFLPIGGPVLLAAWMAHLCRPLYRRVVRRFSGRDRAAAFLTVGLFLALVLPLAGAATTLVSGARELVAVLMKSEGGKGALEALVSRGQGADGGETSLDAGNVANLFREYGASAYSAFTSVATASVEVVVALFVFYAAFFAMLVYGHQSHAWMLRHVPLGPRPMTRLVRAFHEAGRGLLVGTGLTALVQGVLATVAYLVLGVPRALVLGLLTAVAALVPSIGTAIVWVPVAAGLALTGSVGKAVILACYGFGVIGIADNVLRPVLSHSAHLELNTSILLLSMLGGIAAFGTFGLFLGPLVVRLALEALVIAREADVFGRRTVED